MGDIAEQVRIEKRRARRQQKILASAESRLKKITNSQAAMRGGESPITKNSIAEHYPSAIDPRRRKYEENLLVDHRFLTQEHDENAGLIMMEESVKERDIIHKQHDDDKYWDLLHLVSMVWLGIIAVYQIINKYDGGLKQLFVQEQVTTAAYYVSPVVYLNNNEIGEGLIYGLL
ncbi:uncharacterized protein BX663DRAFT_553708 [Cokeromyces recurvatus]|uniref:uncharacterized protein n=1 Tax=Cokeromyces recurvatus TaxID=90255 RepID=UPI00221FE8A1|nr:uncharacterized protein BX663DRAFT_553708 [Cokeromyces recurvatus]KAI7900708.1 hypothetical protein BX663DRAFT_553708 [Cokeromyces recurvatus]